MAWNDDLATAPAWLVQRKVWKRQHVLRRAWWWLVGMPETDELRERYGPGPFTSEEEDRIREIVREEAGRGDS